MRREEFFEGGFVEDGNAEGLGFVEFGAGVAAYDHVAGFFAYCAAGFAAVGCYELFGLFAGATLEGAGEDECFAGELRSFGRGTILFHIDADGAQVVEQFAIGGLGEKFVHTFSDLRADFCDFEKLVC